MTVTGGAYRPVVDGGRWNPWRALRERPHIELVWAEVSCDGLIEDRDGQRRIYLDYRLDRCARNAVLAHELVHDERGVLFPADAPISLVTHEEEQVNRETARRLVPLVALALFVEQVVELGEPVHAAAVADEFDVPLDVAHRALFLLEQRRAA